MIVIIERHINSKFIIAVYKCISVRVIVIGHTMPKAPDPIRTLKLSGIRRG